MEPFPQDFVFPILESELGFSNLVVIFSFVIALSIFFISRLICSRKQILLTVLEDTLTPNSNFSP